MLRFIGVVLVLSVGWKCIEVIVQQKFLAAENDVVLNGRMHLVNAFFYLLNCVSSWSAVGI